VEEEPREYIFKRHTYPCCYWSFRFFITTIVICAICLIFYLPFYCHEHANDKENSSTIITMVFMCPLILYVFIFFIVKLIRRQSVKKIEKPVWFEKMNQLKQKEIINFVGCKTNGSEDEVRQFLEDNKEEILIGKTLSGADIDGFVEWWRSPLKNGKLPTRETISNAVDWSKPVVLNGEVAPPNWITKMKSHSRNALKFYIWYESTQKVHKVIDNKVICEWEDYDKATVVKEAHHFTSEIDLSQREIQETVGWWQYLKDQNKIPSRRS